METVLIFASVLSPIILALVELVKKTFRVPKNLIPLVSLLIGLLIGAAAYPFTDLDLVLRLWAGGLAGLTATGLFEIGKNRDTRQKKNPENMAQGFMHQAEHPHHQSGAPGSRTYYILLQMRVTRCRQGRSAVLQ